MGVRVSASKSALILSPCLAWARTGAEAYNEERVDRQDHTARDNGTKFHSIMDAYYKGELWPQKPIQLQKTGQG